jgi:hypothetical protein
LSLAKGASIIVYIYKFNIIYNINYSAPARI